jgi:septum formation protein
MKLILASSSAYRRERLATLGLKFNCVTPDVDETPKPKESPAELVARLAQAKAWAVAQHYPNALIIGSDQVAVLDNQILGKPGTQEKAIAQLQLLNGQRVRFLTSLCLLNSQTQQQQLCVEPFDVFFRTLSNEAIRHYVKKEQPLNCAGSFKSEGLGITLFERLQGDDPNTLIGLPLIRLTDFLTHEGYPPLNTV